MPGAYRLVIKGHDGLQIGVLSAYESLTYEKPQNDVGKAVLIANYGVTDATDDLLDQLDEDIILEVQRHPDPTDSALDWYVDWIGFCEPPEEGITAANTRRNRWAFQHVNRLLKQRLIAPPRDRAVYEQGREYSVDRSLYSDMPRNVMRQIVREQLVTPEYRTRRVPGLFCQDDEEWPGRYASRPGLFYPGTTDDPAMRSVNCLHIPIWGLSSVSMGIGLEHDIVWSVLETDGTSKWSRGNIPPVWALHEFDGGGGPRLYAACARPGWGQAYIYRSGVNSWSFWNSVWHEDWARGVVALEVHGANLYAGTVYGRIKTPPYGSRARILRTADGTTYAEVYDGNPGGTGSLYGKYQSFEALISWGGYIYAAGKYYYSTSVSGITVLRQCARILRSATGDVGTWEVVLEVKGPVIEEKPGGAFYSDALELEANIDGFCCFAEFGGYLYAGIGDRWRPRWKNGRIYRSADGETWEMVFGADLDDHPEYASPAVNALAAHDGALWAGMGGPSRGDGEVWFSLDGLGWNPSFDQRGRDSHSCHCLLSYNNALYAAFGYVPYTAEGDDDDVGWANGKGYLWRMTSDGWDELDHVSEGSGDWPTVLSVLQKLSASMWDTDGGVDFGIEPTDRGGDLQEFLFSVKSPWGTDRRSTGASPTLFGVNRGNMANPTYQKLKGDRPTAVYALATGQGGDRIVFEMRNTAAEAASPWGRTEGTVSVQGVDTPQEMHARAKAEIDGRGPREVFEFEILESPSTRYGAEWDVGDLATARYNDKTAHVKIEAVTVTLKAPGVEAIQSKIRLLEIVT